MSDTRIELNSQQVEQFSRLLINFSSETINAILSRFSRETRNLIRARMTDLNYAGTNCDLSMLQEFAEFLYFEPSESEKQNNNAPQPIRKPELSKSDRTSRLDSRSPLLKFKDIVAFSDVALDSLLQTAPPELTISVLKCSPVMFVDRVLSRLAPEDAQSIRATLDATVMVEISELQSVHLEYCKFATQLAERGIV